MAKNKKYLTVEDLFKDPDLFKFDKWEKPPNDKLWRLFRYELIDWFKPRILSYRLSRLWFRITKGWSIEDTWSLDSAFSIYIIPILESKFYNYIHGLNPEETIQETKKYWKILQTFYYVKADLIGAPKHFDVVEKEGLKLFCELLIENPNFREGICKWWVERLAEFPKHLHGWPSNLSYYIRIWNKNGDEADEERCPWVWKEIIKKIGLAFQLMHKKELTEDELTLVRKGLSYWVKYFRSLWD